MVRIAVLGCGIMGSKIAGNFADCGHTVKIYDNDVNQLDSVCQRIYRDRDQLHRDGLIEAPLFTGQILTMHRLEDALQDVQFVFECVVEDLQLKRNLIDNVAQLIDENTIICTNTMKLNLNELSENLSKKENFIGVRFLFPVYYIREVEINLSKSTNTKTIESVRNLLESMDKILFFRSTSRPFILDREQQENRRRVRFEFIQRRKLNRSDQRSMLPELVDAPTELLNAVSSNVTNSNQSFSSRTNEGNLICLLCLDRERDALIRCCNHFASCFQCAEQLLRTNGFCPICRGRIDDIIRVFT